MTIWEFIKQLIMLEQQKQKHRTDELRRVEPYRFPVIGTQIRKDK